MHRLLSRDIEMEGIPIERLYIFYDDNWVPVELANLWLLHIAINQAVWGWSTKGTQRKGKKQIEDVEVKFKQTHVAENTARNYVGHVFKLLEYINSLPELSVHRTENLTSRFLNHYLNTVLPERLESFSSLSAHQAGIAAYCNFLCALGIWPEDQNRPTTIYRKTKQYMADKDTRPGKINFVASWEYNDLLRACNSDRDKLILKMGYEVGLRAEENTGLELNYHGQHIGLRSLFAELESKPNKMQWEYILRARFTKGGKTH